jgi:hypothetical protein
MILLKFFVARLSKYPMSDEILIDALVDAGLVQFGYFAEGDKNEFAPVRLNLALLPAYPDVLKLLTDAVVQRLADRTIERLVCTVDSLPLGVAVSLATGIPLVYSQGQGAAAVYDLVGAYDVGHPAALLMNVLDQPESIAKLQANAHRVGLNIQYGVAILGLSTSELVEPLIRLDEMVDSLAAKKMLPANQRLMVLKQLLQQR